MNAETLYDITFIGHMCYDEITHFGGAKHVAPGSAVLCGAVAAQRAGKKVGVITKMNPANEDALARLKSEGIDCHIIPAAETTYMQVIHPSANVDERIMYQQKSAGIIQRAELPRFRSRLVHFAGITDQEFTPELLREMRADGYAVSTDMQSFVRQVNLTTREISFADVARKKEIVAAVNRIKLDIVESRLLTGCDDIAAGARVIASWGCDEVMITQSEGVLVLAGGKEYYEKFTNSNSTGRTGRGDTTFGSYLAWRLDHEVAASIKFAATLVSMKMEVPGPFGGTLEGVLARMKVER